MEILSDWNYGNSLTTEQNRIKKLLGRCFIQNLCKVLTRYIINNGGSNNVNL